MIQKHKYLTLDAIRGVAALFVLTRHAGELFGGLQFPHAYLAVDLFFVMSGFVVSVAYDEGLASRKLSVTDFLKIRAIRLYPLYFFALMFSIFLTGHHARHDISAFNWLEFFVQIFLGLLLIPSPIPGGNLFPLNGPSWSIFFEVSANALYAIFRSYLTNNAVLYAMVAAALMLIICVFQNHNMDLGWNWVNGLGGFPRVIYSFAAGLMIYRIRKSLRYEKRPNNWITLLILLVVILLLGLPITFYAEIYDLIVVIVFLPLLVLLATYIEPTPNAILGKIYAVIGLTSYAIYILQAPYLWAYSGIFLKHGYTSILPGLIAVVSLFFSSFLLDLCYDQPVRRWMRSKFLSATEMAKS